MAEPRANEASPAAPQERAGRLARLAGMAGLGPGQDFARAVHGLGLDRLGDLRGARARLRGNLALEPELVRGDFGRTLRAWGLTEEDLSAYARAKRREAVCGAGLALFAGAAFLLNALFPSGGHLARVLAGMATLSMCASGILMALAAAWRLSVCRAGRFTPFPSWLRGRLAPGAIPRDGSHAAGNGTNHSEES